MRIAFIGLRTIGPSAIGGVEKAIEELSTRLAGMGHDVTVFCRARYERNTSSAYRGVKLRRLPAIYTKHLEAISNTIAAVSCTLRGFDIVHINATGPALLSFAPRLFGNKVVVTVHGLDWKREKWGPLARWSLKLGAWASARFPQLTIVVSKTLQKHYATTYGKDTRYIPNGVTIASPNGIQARNPLGLEKDSYVLFLGRLVPEKGCHVLIEAFRGLETQKKLVIVGPPSHSAEYAESLSRLASGDPRIIFAGARFGAEKAAIYRDAYLFTLPSTIEGMALVLLEAMGHGKGCLCSDIDENLEVIEPVQDTSAGIGRTGMSGVVRPVAARFTTSDVADLRLQLSILLGNPTRVGELGALARAHVARHFNWDTIAAQYADAFQRLQR